MTVTRRSVLIAGTAVPAVGALSGAADARPASDGNVGGRRTLALRDGWRFALVDPGGITDPTGAYTGAERPGYDDSGWRAVVLPHDWSIVRAPTTEYGTTSGTGFFPGGLGWYRTAFTLPSALAGKRISVEFDGVYVTPPQRINPWGFTSASRLTPDKPCPLPKQAISVQRTAAPRTSSRSRCATNSPAAAGIRAAASTATPVWS